MKKTFKELRVEKGFSKQRLADTLNVDYRTITNWEKEGGIIPSISIIADIAEVMGVSTYEVCETFVSEHAVPREVLFGRKPQILDNLKTVPSVPKEFFRWMYTLFDNEHVYTSGMVRYGSAIWDFQVIGLISREYNGEIYERGETVSVGGLSLVPIELSNKEQGDEWLHVPYGFFAADKNMNFMVFSEENVECIHLLSADYGNITFELTVNNCFFPEMECEIKQTQKAVIYLTIFDYMDCRHLDGTLGSQWFSRYHIFLGNHRNNVIGRFIRDIRKTHNLSQSEFADGIVCFSRHDPEITNKTINKWETGITLPSLPQLLRLGESYGFSVKKLLDQFDLGYYVESGVRHLDYSYQIGLNYLFSKITDIKSWVSFLQEFRLIKRSVSELLGNYDCVGQFDDESETADITDISTTSTEIVIRRHELPSISIPIESVKRVVAEKNLANFLYETKFDFVTNKEAKTVKIDLSLFVWNDN